MISLNTIFKSIIKWGSYTILLTITVVVVTFGISYFINSYPPTVQAAESDENVGQVQLQQNSVIKFYEDTFKYGNPIIFPSASESVEISVTVLDNLSLHIDQGQPIYATNWRYGATLYHENIDSQTIIYTVAGDY